MNERENPAGAPGAGGRAVMSSADMVSNVFSAMERTQFAESAQILSAWRRVVESINNRNAQKIPAHSDVVDLKNGILLVEVDHPGWIQLLQLYQKYIVTGMRRAAPALGIQSLAFRLKGSGAALADVDYAKERRAVQERLDAEQRALEERGFCAPGGAGEKPLPEALENLFRRFRADMLTKNQ